MSHNDPVGDKLLLDDLSSTRLGGVTKPIEESQQTRVSCQNQLRGSPHLMRQIDVRLTVICAICSTILYFVCEACMYVIQDKVEDII